MGFKRAHPILFLIARRLLAGIVVLFVVSLLVFFATEILPGNVAYAILGKESTPQSLHALEVQLNLNHPISVQYWIWLRGLLTGDLGVSLANSRSVWSQVAPMLVNSGFLVLVSGALGLLLGFGAGLVSALRRDTVLDHTLSTVALAVTSLPDFVVAIGLVIVFATVVWPVLPAISPIPPGANPWDFPSMLVLPVASLVIITTPYVFRMTRAVLIETLASDYVELARLKGISTWRVVLVHALTNALSPIAQVAGLALLYLAGGIVLIEYIFDYPGLGQGLVNAVQVRDLPVLQAIVLILAAFYVVINICTDVISLLVSPKVRTGS